MRPVPRALLESQQLGGRPEESRVGVPCTLLVSSLVTWSSLITSEDGQDYAGDLERPAVVHSTGGAGQSAVRMEHRAVDVSEAL